MSDAIAGLLRRLRAAVGAALRGRRGPAPTAAPRETEALADAARALGAGSPDDVAQAIADTLRARLGVGLTLVHRVTDDGGGIVVAVSGRWGDGLGPGVTYPRGTGLTGLAIAEGRPVVTPDILTDPRLSYPGGLRERVATTPYRSGIAAPLVGRDGVIGVLVAGDRPGVVFRDEDVRLVQAFAAPAALALENAVLSDRLRRRATRLQSLTRLNLLVSSSLDIRQVLDAVAGAAAALTGATLVSIWIADEAQRVLRRAAFSDPVLGLAHPTESLAFGEGGVGTVAERRETLHVDDLTADPRFIARDWFAAHRLTSALEVPIVSEDRVLGVLAMFGSRPFHLGPEEQEILDGFVAQAALAIRNARLYADAERRREEAETTATIARRITQSLDLPVVLESVARAAQTLLPCDLAHVLLHDPGTDRLLFRYGVGDARGVVRGVPVERGRGIAGMAWSTRQPVRTPDRASDARFAADHRAEVAAEGIGAAIAVPILIRGEVRGVLLAGNRSTRPLSDRDEATLVSLADQSAIALGNVELLERVERARAEAEDANRIKDEFLATLSHELRTPLNAMLGWVRMLRAGGLDAPTTARALEVIERNTRAQTQLINDLLDVSRIVTGKLRVEQSPVDPAPIVEAAVESVQGVADARRVTLRSALDVTVGPVLGDPDRLQQVVWNLLSNAIKFTPPGGRVDVSLRRDGATAELRVTDTGQGIAAEFLPYLFERFRQADSTTTRSAGGLGLGLAIVRHLVEMHGGTVHAESDGPGRGATFTVRLPIMSAGMRVIDWTRSGPDAGRARPSLAGLRVLVVDDEPDARDLFAAVLSEAGATVTATAGARQALAALDEANPHVLVSDISMPEMDGFDLIREVGRRPGTRPPAVAVSAYARREDRDRALAVGFSAHLAKPVEPQALVRAVAAAVGRISAA